MHSIDESFLSRMCGGEIPDNVSALYNKCQVAHHRVHSGPLPYELLLWITVECDAVHMSVPHKSEWHDIPSGTSVVVKESFTERDFCEGTFVRVLDGLQAGSLEIAMFHDMNELRAYPESRVRLKEADQELPEEGPEESLEADVEEPEESEGDPAAQGVAELHEWSIDDIGSRVNVASKEGAIQQGVLVRVPKGKHEGILYVKVDGIHTDKSYGLFPSEDVRLDL